LTEAIDDYLKTIYELEEDGGRASTASIAKHLEIAPASVTGMLKKLSEKEPPWIAYEKHQGAKLTGRGRKRALEVIRHHRLIEKLLHDSLGYPGTKSMTRPRSSNTPSPSASKTASPSN